ncbi:hypothetical protein L0E83_06640 [Marichromatium gracile]|uniref:hypothetical protein n=1 Tax=Marichromatium gracile TaxID=1048 RepID=UPI001F411D1F|nr:hypothetical protein [Marichromatium gracile]MCF1183119.1 hypothetical protein [Marichromatium gracile]
MTDPSLGNCWHCGSPLTRLDYAREGRCPNCERATHCCRNCRHHAPGRANDCIEPIAEAVTDKVRANFCELFEPRHQTGGAAPADQAEALRQAAEALFH